MREFKANYNSVALNIDAIQNRLEELDEQILDIEKKENEFALMQACQKLTLISKNFGVGGVDYKDTKILNNPSSAGSKEIGQLHLDIEKLSRQVNFELASYESIYTKLKTI